MPFNPNDRYRVFLHPLHPPIYEQGGHFFYPDGCEIPKSVVMKILDYVDELCKEWGIPVNMHKKNFQPRTIEEHEKMRQHFWKR